MSEVTTNVPLTEKELLELIKVLEYKQKRGFALLCEWLPEKFSRALEEVQYEQSN